MNDGTSEKWQKVKELLALALEKSAADRSDFLNKVCGSDAELRAEIDSLLAFEATNDTTGQPMSSGTHPARLGVYRLIKELGHGGMGTVYLAERDDDEYRKQVAIKLIRVDVCAGDAAQRFRTERQILASMDHPNIARLLDGGTAENGSPYLIMEYIEGVPILQYCNGKQLNTTDRLGLFRQLCSAVQFAHQHLVIHRDLKPGNILVTAEGVVKLLDFGIAKLLNPELLSGTLDLNSPATRLMTPEYASPEQIRGEMITTSTDVYSLGVLLYKLLTGHSPYPVEGGALPDIMRAVCESEPEKPSIVIHRTLKLRDTTGDSDGSSNETATPQADPDKLHRRLKGDLDNIVLKALNKEPERRYSSVEQLSEDIRRHLSGLPVSAQSPTAFYRFGKFIRRHRTVSVAAILILLTLCGGIIAINQQRVRAEKRFNEVRQLAHSVVFDYHDAIADLPGSTPVRQRLVKDALTYLDSLAKEAKDDEGLQKELAAAYSRIGDVQGNNNMANLGDVNGALQSYRKSLDIRLKLGTSNPEDPVLQREIAESHLRIGDILSETGPISESYKNYDRALTIVKTLSTVSPEDTQLQLLLAKIYFSLGDVKGNPYRPNLGDLSAALEFHRKALSILKAIPDEKRSLEIQADLVDSQRTIAGLLIASGNTPDSEQHARDAVLIAEKMLKADPNSVSANKALSNSREILGRILMIREQWAEALNLYRQILAADRSMAEQDPKNIQLMGYLSSDYTQIGHILANQRNYTEALRSHREAIRIDEAIAAADKGSDEARYSISIGHLSAGDVLLELGDLTAALDEFGTAVRIQQELVQKDPNDSQAALNLAYASDRLGETLNRSGRPEQAVQQIRPGIAVGEAAIRKDPDNHRAARQLAVRYIHLGDGWNAMARGSNSAAPQIRNQDEACKAYRRSLELIEDLKKKNVLPPEHSDKPELLAAKLSECKP